ncbi:MAG: DUF1559 family PulG-like putative transporter [Planctomycetota bacterium]|jgi:hypothetical protein
MSRAFLASALIKTPTIKEKAMRREFLWLAFTAMLPLLVVGCGEYEPAGGGGQGGGGGGQEASPTDASSAESRQTSLQNVKRILSGMHAHHDAHRKLPPAVVVGPDGQTPHSWRVALLPYLGMRALYDQYRQDEPWDGPNNSKLLAQMPAFYRSPLDPPDSANTAYFVLVGPGTLFEGEEGTPFSRVIDGTSNTLCVVECKRDVPWTKPEDVPYDPNQPKRGLGGYYQGAFIFGTADGRSWLLDASIDVETLKNLITYADAQPIDFSRYQY